MNAGGPETGGTGDGISHVVQRNIAALVDLRQRQERRNSISDRVADGISAFAGSVWFVYVHAALLVAYLVINLGLLAGIKAFDPFPFVMLAMITSVEAIFLSTFILITQNRMQKHADRRAELDLQISLLAEHELTQVARVIDGIARHMGVARPPEKELAEVEKDIDPKRVAREIERAEGEIEVSRKES